MHYQTRHTHADTHTHTDTIRHSLSALLRRELFEKDAGLKVNERAREIEGERGTQQECDSVSVCR